MITLLTVFASVWSCFLSFVQLNVLTKNNKYLINTFEYICLEHVRSMKWIPTVFLYFTFDICQSYIYIYITRMKLRVTLRFTVFLYFTFDICQRYIRFIIIIKCYYAKLYYKTSIRYRSLSLLYNIYDLIWIRPFNSLVWNPKINEEFYRQNCF